MKYLYSIIVTLILVGVSQTTYACIACEADYPDIFKQADEGNPRAQYVLAWMYATGRNVEKNDEKSFYWLNKSVENGWEYAYYRLGDYYLNGIGVTKDVAKAIELFERFAFLFKGGEAAKALFNIYNSGEYVPKDPVLAYKWIKISSPDRDTEEIKKLISEMAPNDIERGETLAKEWLLKTKNNPLPSSYGFTP